MAEGQKYLIRDPQGNVYGPADGVLLREWAAQGRIVPGMGIAAKGTREWVEASVHPETAGALAERMSELKRATETGVGGQVVEGEAVEETAVRGVEMVEVSQVLPGEGAVRRVEEGRIELGYAMPARQNVLGVLSLVLGCLSLMTMCGTCVCLFVMPVGGLVSLGAITTGSVGLWQINAKPEAYTGKGLAIAGICLGSLSLLVSIGWIVLGFGLRAMSKP